MINKKATGKDQAKKIDFYNDCLKAKIQDCKSEKEVQKVTLIAEKYGLQTADPTSLYAEAKALSENKSATEHNASLDAKRKEEREEQKILNQYAFLTGREKRIAMLTASRQAYLQQADTLRKGAHAVMNASQQKEKSWALHGGLAEGLAGPAAGVATAMNVQSQNAQIRAQNEANRKAFAPLLASSYTGAADCDRAAKSLAAEIEEAKTKLIAKDDAATCLKRLVFTDTKVEVSETGTCTVTTKADLTEKFKIFEDVPAVVDGSVIAKIYDGNTLVGTAELVLPNRGIDGYKYPAPLKGMCLFCAEPGKDYTVEFAAVNLWAMED